MNMHDPIDFREFARALGTVVDYATGNTVFSEGDTPRYMYIVLAGSVDIVHRDKLIETIAQGDAFGILGLLDEQPRTVTARAKENCELAVIERKKFRYMVEEVPNFVWYVMDELAQRLRSTNAAL
ncbi:MAG: cyclic nucleotide-binding domain-containing protein [Rhodoplanes sp.]|uniref:cyclic nucleotide-binding domain-containing protein n=1 Tax=Rhodoplanes sp. TaxID=1968906 RepID=UPI00184274D2|nr:cyclic nucleotide-binding domain-containing protein [Rhodoplanes sp.]NVO14029.1 cyclic nucleotide-binding domain-containing protein [Rhodoplanes sp.]